MTIEAVIAAIAAGLLLVLLGSAELGYRLARRAPGTHREEASQIGNWEGALLGLLALLIGFTFAMAVTRFDGRREMILEEASAIQQLARRAEYLAPPVQERMGGLLRSYVDARIRAYDAGLDPGLTEAAYREAVALQRQLWAQAVEVARNNFNSEMASLFVESVDAVLEQGARRRAALDNHVPLTVMILLWLVACISVGATGYVCGLRRHRHRFGMVLLPILIATVLLLVVALDHPRSGLVQVGQGPMLRLHQSLNARSPW
jgi:hypothetical protein